MSSINVANGCRLGVIFTMQLLVQNLQQDPLLTKIPYVCRVCKDIKSLAELKHEKILIEKLNSIPSIPKDGSYAKFFTPPLQNMDLCIL